MNCEVFDLYYSFYNPFFCIFIQLFLFIVLDLEESFQFWEEEMEFNDKNGNSQYNNKDGNLDRSPRSGSYHSNHESNSFYSYKYVNQFHLSVLIVLYQIK